MAVPNGIFEIKKAQWPYNLAQWLIEKVKSPMAYIQTISKMHDLGEPNGYFGIKKAQWPYNLRPMAYCEK